jgi:hypothetical protein
MLTPKLYRRLSVIFSMQLRSMLSHDQARGDWKDQRLGFNYAFELEKSFIYFGCERWEVLNFN